MALREPNQKELKRIRAALRYFGSEDFLENYALLVNERKEVFAVSKDVLGLLEGLTGKPPVSVGVKVGEVGRRFRFSLEGAFWLVKKRRKIVVVNERGEMLFLYGRDLFTSSIVEAKGFGENELVFVYNRRGDVIGMGRSRFPAEMLEEVSDDRVFVDNLVDRGEYIRHTKLYSSF